MNRKTLSALVGALGVVLGALGGPSLGLSAPAALTHPVTSHPVTSRDFEGMSDRLDRIESKLDRLIERR